MLAWIRTGLALMGFGFVVAKFGLFLRRLEELQLPRLVVSHGTGSSLWIGVVLVSAGVFVNVAAAFRFRRVILDLRHGRTPSPTNTAMAFYLALVMAGIGVAIAAYLSTLPR